jgi:hypothetical protein
MFVPIRTVLEPIIVALETFLNVYLGIIKQDTPGSINVESTTAGEVCIFVTHFHCARAYHVNNHFCCL